MCGWRMMTKEEMVKKLCELYEKNDVVYSLEEVKKMDEEQLKDEMVEYADI